MSHSFGRSSVQVENDQAQVTSLAGGVTRGFSGRGQKKIGRHIEEEKDGDSHRAA
jgi:hypothetical protein